MSTFTDKENNYLYGFIIESSQAGDPTAIGVSFGDLISGDLTAVPLIKNNLILWLQGQVAEETAKRDAVQPSADIAIAAHNTEITDLNALITKVQNLL